MEPDTSDQVLVWSTNGDLHVRAGVDLMDIITKLMLIHAVTEIGNRPLSPLSPEAVERQHRQRKKRKRKNPIWPFPLARGVVEIVPGS